MKPSNATLALLIFLLVAGPALGQTLRIYHIDVEQADATLFVSSGGHTIRHVPTITALQVAVD